MKFSVFTVSTPEYGLEDTLKLLKEIGYNGVEWRVTSPPPDQKPDNYTFEGRYWSYNLSTIDINKVIESAEEVKGLCKKYNIEICSLTTYLRPADVWDIDKVLKAANIMGCRNIRVMPPNYNEKENYRVLFDRTVNQVKVLEELASRYGVRINFETHMGNMIPSASAAYRFVSNFNPDHIGIIYDPGNMVYEGFENYRMGIELLGEYLAHVHLKNAVWKLNRVTEDGIDIWKPEPAPCKKGFADLKKLIGVLQDAGYNGYVSVEDFSNEKDTYTKLKENLEFLRLASTR